MAMNIEKLHETSKFRIDCKEHDAVIRCDATDLRPVGIGRNGKWVFTYTCPICGESHNVTDRDLTEIQIYKSNVRLDDERLPINRRKKAEDLIGTIANKMGDLDSTINKINKRTTHLFKKVSRNVSEAAETTLKNITE